MSQKSTKIASNLAAHRKSGTLPAIMKVISLKDVPNETVTLDGAVGCACRVAISPRDGAENFAMRIFEVAPGGHTPLHQHPYEHEVYVIEGQGSVWRDGDEVGLQSGNILFIPADEKHQFTNKGDCVFRFICLIPAQFQKC